VALQDTCQQFAKLKSPPLAVQSWPSPPTPKARTLSSRQMANGSVSIGPRIPLARSVTNVATTMVAACAETHPTALRNARPGPDPRSVFTPIIVDRTIHLLHTLGLQDKWKHIIAGLQDGFDVGIKEAPTHTLIFDNHASSRLDPAFISTYLENEESVGRYSQPFSPSQLEDIIGPFRTSPIGLVPKSGSSKFRMIQDLSFPRNHSSIASVNAGINSDDFPTGWGTFDATSNLVLSLPAGSLAATFDISAAYRITPIRPDQQNSLCILWEGMVRIDRAVMFGMSSSAGVFGSIADMLVDIYTSSGFGPVVKWVDDFFVIRLPNHTWTVTDFVNLTAAIGIPWSNEKLRPLASVQRYIGFDWHLDSKSVSIPSEKVTRLQELLQSWLFPNIRMSAHDAASIHGKLVHISCIFTLIRPFLRSLAIFAAKFHSYRARLFPPPSVLADIRWILSLLQVLPNHSLLKPPVPEDRDWWGDASTSFGIGITVGSFWAVWKWADGISVGPKCRFDIGWAEAVAVELALQVAIVKEVLTPGHFLVRSDNAGVVAVLNKGQSRSHDTNNVLKSIYMSLAHQNLRISAVYVPSRFNVTDALSRGDIKAFLKGFPKARIKAQIPLPSHLAEFLVPL
jgi:hypothetical protein